MDSEHRMDQNPIRLNTPKQDRPAVSHRGRVWQRLILWVLNVRIAARWRRAAEGDVRRFVWSDNTKRMGVRFSERVRDAWRGRWIRLHTNSDD
jgi:hypothetical protein